MRRHLPLGAARRSTPVRAGQQAKLWMRGAETWGNLQGRRCERQPADRGYADNCPHRRDRPQADTSRGLDSYHQTVVANLANWL